MSEPTVVDFWQAHRTGDPSAIAAAEWAHARALAFDQTLRRATLAEARAERYARIIASIHNAAKAGNLAAIVHVCEHAHDTDQETAA